MQDDVYRAAPAERYAQNAMVVCNKGLPESRKTRHT